MMDDETGSNFGVYAKRTGKEVRLAMQELWLTGTVLPVGARLVVRHVFQSAEAKPLELIYAFALPRDAAMRSFRIVGDGFESQSDLRPAPEAERLYEEGIESGHLSAMARAYGDGLVNLSVGNVRPTETVTVYLEIAAGVELHDDGFRLRFPFTLAPSYHPRAATTQPESGSGEMSLPEDEFGDLILPPWRRDAEGLHQVGFDLAVDLPSAVLSIASPSHAIAVHANGRSVQLAVAADVPNRDLVLDVRYGEKKPLVLAGIDSGGKGRVVAVVPSACFGDAPSGPRRTVFLIDRSGSMGGKPMQQALRATEACLGALSALDHFGIVAFDDRTETFAPVVRPANVENRNAARQFLTRIDARGGTELAAGLEEAALVLGAAGGDIVVLTDGQVFGGEAVLARARRTGLRVHCLGIGSASQDRFLALVARTTGGTSRFVTPRERVDMALLEVFASLGAPVATEVRCETPEATSIRIEPDIPEVVYSGSPLVIMGSFSGSGAGALQISWAGGAVRGALTLETTVTTGALGNTLKLLQGARLITDTESRLVNDSGSAEGRASAGTPVESISLNERLTALSTEYGLASRAMALVAVVKRQGDIAGQLPRTQVVPIGMPQDVDMNNCLGAPSMAPVSRLCSLTTLSRSVTRHCAMEEDVDQDLSIPSFMRKRTGRVRRASEKPAAPPALEDLLVDLASTILPDGGAAGRSAETRIAASLLLLLLFVDASHTVSAGAFAAHIRRLTQFLEGADRSHLDTSQTEALTLVLKSIGASKVIVGPWSAIASEFSQECDRWRSQRFWNALAGASIVSK